MKERYENHHKVRIKDEAIIAVVELSNRYITESFLPDNGIDLMYEAAAKLRMERDSVPEELDEISCHLKQLEIEREAIKREKDESKLQQLNKEKMCIRDSSIAAGLSDITPFILNLLQGGSIPDRKRVV